MTDAQRAALIEQRRRMTTSNGLVVPRGYYGTTRTIVLAR